MSVPAKVSVFPLCANWFVVTHTLSALAPIWFGLRRKGNENKRRGES